MNVSNLEQWTQLRYQYYMAGRTLLFNNQMQTGVLMLGYSIETHMKHLVSSFRSFPKKLSYGHDFQGLYEACLEQGYFRDVGVSDDFLLFIEDNFHRRYPSQTDESIKRANSRGHAICMAPDVILAYDDFILQLDHSLTKVFNSPRASIMLWGGKGVDSADGKYFFHCNYAAIRRIEQIIKYCEWDLELIKEQELNIYDINLKSHQERVVLLNDIDRLIQSLTIRMSVIPSAGLEGAKNAAKSFSYPGRYFETANGRKIHITSW